MRLALYCWITNPSEEKLDLIANWFFIRAVDVRINGEKFDLSVKPENDSIDTGLATFDKDWLYIKSIDFHGRFCKSKSNKWVICWSDSDKTLSKGGYRESGHGRYILYDLENDVIVTQGEKLERPNNGDIADNGTFSLEDWHFGNNLSGTIYVYSYNGHQKCLVKSRTNLVG